MRQIVGYDSKALFSGITKQNGPKSKISEWQYGYQKGKSTTDCIFLLHSVISKVLNFGQKLYSVFIDYEKCFDRINRVFLWQKLLAENVSSKMTNALRAIYTIHMCDQR